jgi:indolepyruvate ferredoxin oxidoreductase
MSSGYQLSDRFNAADGTVYLTGVQALARIPIEQVRRDRAAGLNTAAFVSGYPGSPLGGFDQELSRALRTAGLPITHLPAVNEELAATAVMGSQLAPGRPDARFDGVVGVWYGKAPGMDRATDALRHAVFAGASPHGGALALVGDDPAAKSSTMPSSSDAALVDLHMPILYPATIAECLELGLHGIAMSRTTGLWSALKIVTPVADGTGTVTFPVMQSEPVIPHTIVNGQEWHRVPSAQFLGPRMVQVEREFHEVRSTLALRYVIDNKLNVVHDDPADAWITLIATGFTYSQMREALNKLGIPDDRAAEALGIRIVQLRVPIPFDREFIRAAARDSEEVFVIEEKNPTLELLVRDALYGTSHTPLVVGKTAPDGTPLIPSWGMLDSDTIAAGLRARLEGRLGDRLTPRPPKPRELIALSAPRQPYFCSGCPHNWGTKAPEGAVVGMGTGCHGMTLLMDETRVGDSIGITAMGNEGAQWLGMAPFVDTDHVFQNFGDGTYFHSGQLAVQAAIGAGANITFKILYNHTVAMTGGQDASHKLSVAQLATVLLQHGVKRVVVTTDDPKNYDQGELPSAVAVEDRTEIVSVQSELAQIEGVTVLINDQECAAELRRGRKRKTVETPKTRVVINHRICEGCGDCGDVSNCLSVQPVETSLGRKTQIDQASCNFDMSCLNGDCPAFMTVEVDPSVPAAIPQPLVAFEISDPTPVTRNRTAIRFAGIGGTGVVTAAQIVGTAAMLAGLEVDGVDQTGLSQKAGPVVSDLVLTSGGHKRLSNLVPSQQADVLVAFDQLVAAADANIGVTGPQTAIFASTATTPTGPQVADPFNPTDDTDAITERLRQRGGAVVTLNTLRLAEQLIGHSTAANLMLIGVAFQAGELPIPSSAIIEAIGLNGVAVEANVAAFMLGRRWYADRDAVEAAADATTHDLLSFSPGPITDVVAARLAQIGLPADLSALVEGRCGDLIEYQDEGYAMRYLSLVHKIERLKNYQLTEAVAQNFHKLLAYKDEYEVARLMLAPDGLAVANAVAGESSDTLTWKLHPPMLKALGMNSKMDFGPRSAPAFRALAKGKRVRGSVLDPFGRTELRRLERRLIDDYERLMIQISSDLTIASPDALTLAVEIAELPDMIRGFEDLKKQRATQYELRLDELLAELAELEGT